MRCTIKTSLGDRKIEETLLIEYQVDSVKLDTYLVKSKNGIDIESLWNCFTKEITLSSSKPAACVPFVRLSCHGPVIQGGCIAGSLDSKRSGLKTQIIREDGFRAKPILSITFTSNNEEIN